MPVTLVSADLTALPDVADLFNQYRQFYQQEDDLPRATAFIQARLVQGDSLILLARSSAGEALGFAQLYPSFSSIDCAASYLLSDLFTAPSARGQGVGRALLLAAREQALDSGRTSLTLETAVDNLTAQRLYESVGFVREQGFLTYIWAL
ncbi:GNAT family N-acetyltransferase [Pseudomonas neustonica]|mgnify:FL=1|jgi:ribosomal protein S18 acetylase RimI-like enzyme|uniref:GNAT family N-acetyltransferase n=1 Tax=Pseudomonas neustonica TaxID=2487346 RepID=A0ABX9XLI9_9PSED|nr:MULTISPECIES: GNAT family N-acetyltransferase [Pseudomonas]MBA6419419.1 GNAT family N-acetyltransferase [Pseudomonas sp. 5Ae-yellow]ROZ86068.1 GNAT family N-acetyltransferase [Pseudomonas sp. SSM44]ROZ87793.1 GNAT family N-acetyltransferase [Pseudomonas neustonica]|tara:strand:+ start:1724 stop:2173 length:450 start_codon:yes stop_codon:yes gene_type:complete